VQRIVSSILSRERVSSHLQDGWSRGVFDVRSMGITPHGSLNIHRTRHVRRGGFYDVEGAAHRWMRSHGERNDLNCDIRQVGRVDDLLQLNSFTS
jgi:hypothetical protein